MKLLALLLSLIALTVSGCVGWSKSSETLALMSDQDLIKEATSPAAYNPGYLAYDGEYRQLVLDEWFKRHHPSPTSRKNLTERRLWLGCSKNQARLIMGRPRTASTTTSEHGQRTYWHYGYGIRRGDWSGMLVFDDGLLVSITDG